MTTTVRTTTTTREEWRVGWLNVAASRWVPINGPTTREGCQRYIDTAVQRRPGVRYRLEHRFVTTTDTDWVATEEDP